MTASCADSQPLGMRPMQPNPSDSGAQSHQKSHHLDAEDRLRRLELVVAELAESWAEQLERQAELRERVERLEDRLGAITSPRVSQWE
jgi:hypothetical protein